jgi:hypothetical protein
MVSITSHFRAEMDYLRLGGLERFCLHRRGENQHNERTISPFLSEEIVESL